MVEEALCIYLAKVAVRPADGRGTPEGRYCFIPAPDPTAASRRLDEALRDAGHQLLGTEFLLSYWDYEWPRKADQKHYDGFAQQAYRSRQPVLAV